MRLVYCSPFAVLLSFFQLALLSLSADNWPEFRGPHGDGRVPGAKSTLPTTWSDSSNIAWRTPIPGSGHSTPSVWGNQIWVTTATTDGKKMSVFVIDRLTGKILHKKLLFENENPFPLGNKVNGYASPSPVTEEGRAYVHFGSYGTACFDTSDYSVIWQRRDLPCRHYRGPGSSPVLYNDLLILTMDGIDHQYLVALDKKTGKTVWKRDRSTEWNDLDEEGKPKADGDYRKAYSTPIIVKLKNGDEQLVSTGARATWAYNPRTGEELWQVPYEGFSNAARPVFANHTLLINTGYGKAQLWALPLTGEERGELGEKIVWKQTKRISQRSSPVVVGNRVYLVDDGGRFSGLDLKTGEPVFTSVSLKGQYSASPVVANGLIYLFDEDGTGVVLRPKDSFEEVARNQLEEGMYSSPATDGEALFLRTVGHLYCIRAVVKH